jgi:hypothetical protein
MPAQTALMLLKPDALAGPYAHCDRALARDTVRGLLLVYAGAEPMSPPYECATSAYAVEWGLRNVRRKVRARFWYTDRLVRPEPTLRRLAALLTTGALAGPGDVPVRTVVLAVAAAMGFEVAVRRTLTVCRRDLLGLYAQNTHFPRLAGALSDYLLGKQVEVLLLRGDQEVSTLHIGKELVRRVVRYPTTHYDALENLLHVSDPDAQDQRYFAGMLAATWPARTGTPTELTALPVANGVSRA